MKKQPMVSIIIPVRAINHFITESMSYLQKLHWQNYEILIFPNQPNKKYKQPKTRVIPSGEVGPAIKRDLALRYAQGELLAFIDDDAFPSKDWLNAALPHFQDPQIAAVGGPGVTPLNASFLEQASGWVSASPVGAGPYTYRFIPMKRRLVDDYPSMNLIVRKDVFEKVGGFDSHYYPGEDTKLCLDIINLGYSIMYEPKAFVHHHRRPLWLPHLKQNGGFGIHRGFFARILPKTSAKPIYFLPTLLVINIVFVLLSLLFYRSLILFVSFPLFLYVFALLANSLWIGLYSKSLSLALISLPAIVLTHIWYGLRFLQGYFFTKQLTQ